MRRNTKLFQSLVVLLKRVSREAGLTLIKRVRPFFYAKPDTHTYIHTTIKECRTLQKLSKTTLQTLAFQIRVEQPTQPQSENKVDLSTSSTKRMKFGFQRSHYKFGFYWLLGYNSNTSESEEEPKTPR